jgi:hypothetical protein
VPDIAIAALLAVLTAILLLILDPLADVPMNDDFSWARSAEAFARTGKIVYNGWGNPILLPHIVAGGIVIKLFGFSHVALGAFGIVSGAFYAGAIYLLARACQVDRALAGFLVALAVLNPVFLGNAPTFMSDVPSAFLYTCALLAFVKAAYLPEGETKYRLRPTPIVIATLFAFLAGANRQILWAALAVAFATGFLYLTPADRTKKLAPAIAILLLGAIGLSAWFASQPYSVTVSLGALNQFLQSSPELIAWYPYKFLSMLGLACLPITIPFALTVWKGIKRPAPGFALCLACGIVPFLVFLVLPAPSREYWNGIWRLTAYGQYATFQGVMVGGPAGFEARPWMMPGGVGTLLNILGAVGIGLLLWCLVITNGRRTFAANVVLAGALAQIVLPLPWYATGSVFDRYLVSLVPMFLIALTARPLGREAEASPTSTASLKPYLVGMPLAAIFAFGGVTFAMEYFGYTQARAKLYHALLKQNIAPEHIDAGVETSGDTQIALGRYINNVNIKNPPDAYQESSVGNCSFAPGYFPVMDAEYLLHSQSTTPDISQSGTRNPLVLDPDPVMKEEYRSPIAPNIRTIHVYRVRKM